MPDMPDKPTEPQLEGPDLLDYSVRTPQKITASPIDPPPGSRQFGDYNAFREYLLDRVKTSTASARPATLGKYTLRVADVDYAGKRPTTREEQEAVLQEKDLGMALKGRYELVDKDSGDVVKTSSKRTLMKVPWLTRDGTFVFKGIPYSFRNQFRMDPGIYTRVGSDGVTEAQVNVKQGTGIPFKVRMEPSTGVMAARMAGKTLPLYWLLNTMGVKDEAMRKAWGPELFKANSSKRVHSAAKSWLKRTLDKERTRLTAKLGEDQAAELTDAEISRELFNRMELDPDNTKRLTGKSYERVTPEALLHTSLRILGVRRGEEDPDIRDSPSNQRIYDVGDFIDTYLKLDHNGVMRDALYKLRQDPENLDKIKPSLLQDHWKALLNQSGLAQVLEQMSPMDQLNQAYGVTRLGEGAIASTESAPEEARRVQPGYFGYVDPTRSPESSRIGLDMFLARGVVKGPDNRLYARFVDTKTGKSVWKNPIELENEFVAPPGAFDTEDKYIPAISPGKGVQYLDRNKIRYMLASGDDMFSEMADTMPFKSGVSGLRMLMGSKYLQHAVPLKDGEAPLVQTADKEGKPLFQSLGRMSGAIESPVDGTVTHVTDTSMTITGADGEEREIPYYSWMPYARKTHLEQQPLVKPGDKVEKGSVIVKSNFTDPAGNLNMGKNMRIGYMPYKGLNTEDATIITESAAKKLTSVHTDKVSFDLEDTLDLSRDRFSKLFPSKYSTEQMEKVGPDGVVAEGSIIQPGDPLFLAIGTREASEAVMGRRQNTDRSKTWDHEDEGVVRKVVHTRNGPRVYIETERAAGVGDKLCYADDTEVLTDTGWKALADIDMDDALACLDPLTGQFTYMQPAALHKYWHDERMYSLETQQVELLTTDNHSLYIQPRYKDEFSLVRADEVFGQCVRHKKNGDWVGGDRDTVDLPGYWKNLKGGNREWVPSVPMPLDTYLMLLGMFLSEGNTFWYEVGGSYGIKIRQSTEGETYSLRQSLSEAGISYTDERDGTGIRIHNKALALSLMDQGKSWEKFVPNWVFGLRPEKLRILFAWLMWGDGQYKGTKPVAYFTSSYQLADDVQRLCLHIGMAANVHCLGDDCPEGEYNSTIKETGQRIYRRRAYYRVAVITTKLTPQVNHGHTRTQNGQKEQWVQYRGWVVCPTMPENHIIYVRRKGKGVWCGNSVPHGGKGVVSRILPDDQAPRDSKNRPLDILISPKGVPSRTNPAQLTMAWLGKVADKNKERVVVPGFSEDSYVEFAEKELEKAGLTDTETVYDPVSGKEIPEVMTGMSYIYKLQQMSEGKLKARGVGEQYSMDEDPGRGGPLGSKHYGPMENSALMGHHVPALFKELKTVHGQYNPDFWRQVRWGQTPQVPDTPNVYNKFRALLRSSGVTLRETRDSDSIFASTDKDIRELTGDREITSPETYDKKMRVVRGGLFDSRATKSDTTGDSFSYIAMPEPVLNPLMEDTVRYLTGMSQQDMSDIMTGEKPVQGLRGGAAMQQLLKGLNLDNIVREAKTVLKSDASISAKDKAGKQLMRAEALKEAGVTPDQFMFTRIPVLPPKHRQVVEQQDRLVVPDVNYLYRNVLFAKQDYEDAAEIGGETLNQARDTLTRSVRELIGTKPPASRDLQNRRVGGLLQQMLGKGSPKASLLHRKVLGFNADLTGMGVSVPNTDLRLNEVGVPEEAAWKLFSPTAIRRLVQQGWPATRAAQEMEKRTDAARSALLKDMDSRPVLLNRAPTLHKYGIMAFKPKMVGGNAIQVNPLICGPYGLDFDGNCCDYDEHVFLRLSKSLLETDEDWRYLVYRSGSESESSERTSIMLDGQADVFRKLGGDVVVRRRIGELPKQGVPLKDKNGADVYRLPDGVQVLSYDTKTAKRGFYDATHYTVEKDCPSVTVKIGSREITVSSNESLSVFNHRTGALEKIAPADAKGRYVPRVVGITDSYGDYAYREWGWWVGVFAGDGWVTDNTVGHSKLAVEITREFVRLTGELYKKSFTAKEYISDELKDDKYGRSAKVHMNSKELAAVVKSFGFYADEKQDNPRSRSALFKQIPEGMLVHGCEDFLWGLASGLMDGDCSLNINTAQKKSRFYVRFNTSSERFKEGIVELFMRLGISCSVTETPARGKSNRSWVIIPSSPSLYANLDRIQCVSEKSAEFFRKWAGQADYDEKWDRTDVIPLTDAEAGAVCEVALALKDRSAYSGISRDRVNPRLQRATARRMLEHLPEEQAASLRMKVESSVRWDTVKAVEDVGNRDVFDLVIPDTKVFVTTGGLVVYDTQSLVVPVSAEAVEEARDKMMPEKNLISEGTGRPQFVPFQETLEGFFLSSRPPKKRGKVRVFKTDAEATEAWEQGRIDVDDAVHILEAND